MGWLIFLLSVFAWAPLTYPGYFEFHSGFLPIFNLNDLAQRLADLGSALAWAPAVGQSYDLWRGERGLPYLLALLPRAVGVAPATAIKLIFAASIAGGALGLYGWARRRSGGWPGLVAAFIYALWPIGLATVYVRGALAEAVFLGLMPWVWWAADAAVAGRRWAAPALTLTLAVAFWTQAGLALWLAALVLIYLLSSGVSLRRRSRAGRDATAPMDDNVMLSGLTNQRSPRQDPSEASLTSFRTDSRVIRDPSLNSRRDALHGANPLRVTAEAVFKIRVLIAWLGGVALAALGLLPLIVQRGLGGADAWPIFADHFVCPHQLLLAGWGVGPSLPGPYDTLTFQLGLAACGLAVFGIILYSQTPTLPVIIVLLLTFLSTTLAAPLWRFLPFLARTLTYPWQLLLLVGPWLAWLAGLGARGLLKNESRHGAGACEVPGASARLPLVAALLLLTLLGAYDYLQPKRANAPIPDAPLAIFGDNEIALLSAVTAGPPGPGGRVTALVRWQALRPLAHDYTVFFHAIGPDGKRWGQQDTMPQNNQFPTSQWRPGQVVTDQYQALLAAGAPISREYRYDLGLYQWQTGQRLSTGADDKVVLGP